MTSDKQNTYINCLIFGPTHVFGVSSFFLIYCKCFNSATHKTLKADCCLQPLLEGILAAAEGKGYIQTQTTA